MDENELLDSNGIDDVVNFDKIKKLTLGIFWLFGLTVLFSVVFQFIIVQGHSNKFMIPIFRLALIILCLFFTYKGKNWARGILTFIIVSNSFIIVFRFIKALFNNTLNYFDLINVGFLIISISTLGLLYFYKPFQEFYQHQKQKYQKFTSRII